MIEISSQEESDEGPRAGSSSNFESLQVSLPMPGSDDTSTTEQQNPTLSSDHEKSDMDHLISMFKQLSSEQINAIYLLSGKNFNRTLQCLLEGPTIDSIIAIMKCYFDSKPMFKIDLDLDSAWQDLLAYYKSSKVDFNLRIRISLARRMTIDTGGIRRQIYTQVFSEFAHNKHVVLFDGSINLLRPAISAIARSSGILKILGKMLSHSIFQDGIGFPYLSPVCYWYIIGSEDMAIEHLSLDNLPADSSALIKEVII